MAQGTSQGAPLPDTETGRRRRNGAHAEVQGCDPGVLALASSYLPAFRRDRTAWASSSSSGTVRSQPMQASVMLCP